MLDGKRAVLCAASRGLGRAVAEEMAAQGARVAMGARSVMELDAVADGIERAGGARPFTHVLDLSDAESIARFADAAHEALGGVDVLVNNTGGPKTGTFDTLSDDDFAAAYDLVLMSNVRMTRALLPALRVQGNGAIVNILSVGVKHPLPALMLSNAMRLGLVGLTKTLADEVAADGVRVVNVAPGSIRTDRIDQLIRDAASRQGTSVEESEQQRVAAIPLHRMGMPTELAQLVCFLASDAARFLTGITIPVDGGFARSAL